MVVEDWPTLRSSTLPSAPPLDDQGYDLDQTLCIPSGCAGSAVEGARGPASLCGPSGKGSTEATPRTAPRRVDPVTAPSAAPRPSPTPPSSPLSPLPPYRSNDPPRRLSSSGPPRHPQRRPSSLSLARDPKPFRVRPPPSHTKATPSTQVSPLRREATTVVPVSGI